MDVREFVKQSLLDIIGGVLDAQRELRDLGRDAVISPEIHQVGDGIAYAVGRRQPVSNIEFDLAVTVAHAGAAEAGGNVKGGFLSVLSASAEGKAQYEHQRSDISRLRFQVPVAMPRDGHPLGSPAAGGG